MDWIYERRIHQHHCLIFLKNTYFLSELLSHGGSRYWHTVWDITWMSADWWHSCYPAGIFDADKGLESGLSLPNFQYFRSHSSPVCHYCNVIHLSLFFGSCGSKPVPFWDVLKLVQKKIYRKSSTQNGPRSTIMLVSLSGHGPDHARWVQCQQYLLRTMLH